MNFVDCLKDELCLDTDEMPGFKDFAEITDKYICINDDYCKHKIIKNNWTTCMLYSLNVGLNENYLK